MTTEDKEGESRKRLGFAGAVAEHIEPLLTALGFAYTEMTPYQPVVKVPKTAFLTQWRGVKSTLTTGCYVVRFESAQVLLVISDNRLSYEIEVTFSCKADPSRRYALRDMLDTVLGSDHKREDFFQASKPDRVVACVQAIAERLQKYGRSALAGDPLLYQRIAEVAQLRNATFTKHVAQRPIRKAAEEAWQRRDYGKVRELYGSIENDLGPVEQRKLKYAKTH